MDYRLTVTSTAQMALLKAIHPHFIAPPQTLLRRRNLKHALTSYNRCHRISASFASAPPSHSLCIFRSLLRQTPFHFRCFSSSAASFTSSAGGGNDGAGAGVGGGGSGGESGDGNLKLVVDAAAQDLSVLSTDVIILDVSGMACGGCAASVKRILESQPQVSSASVNLTTETAIVWPVSEAKTAPNWQKQLGEALAEHLTGCGFNSSLRDSARDNFLQIFQRKIEEKRKQLRESGRELAVSWVLCAVCLVGHLSFMCSKSTMGPRISFHWISSEQFISLNY